MISNRKSYILCKTKNALELISVNCINITSTGLVFKVSNYLLENNYSEPLVDTFKCFLTIGILSINFAYSNYNI